MARSKGFAPFTLTRGASAFLTMAQKYQIEVSPNRSRGYDACVLFFACGEWHGLSTHNAPSETAARALAEDALKKQKAEDAAFRRLKKPGRALSEGDLESIEAARNERDYQ